MPEHPEACAAWQEDLVGWLVAQLAPEREALLHAHLASCATCRAEADSLLAVTAASLAAEPEDVRVHERHSTDLAASMDAREDPPAALREQVLAAVAVERRSRWRVRAGLAGVAGAAAVAAAASIGLLVRDPAPAVHGETVAFTVVPPGASATVVVGPDDSGGSVVQLTATGLDPRVTYALWLSPPKGSWDDRAPAGTFRPDSDGKVDVRLRCALAPDEYTRVWATTPGGAVALDTQ